MQANPATRLTVAGWALIVTSLLSDRDPWGVFAIMGLLVLALDCRRGS